MAFNKRLCAYLLLTLVLPVLADPVVPPEPGAGAGAGGPGGPTAALAPAPVPSATGPEISNPQGVVGWATDHTQELLATALSSLGVKYRRGASDPSVGFDCSGFVRHVYKTAVGLLLPHNAYSMSLQGKSVGLDELKPGDLVFFNTLKRQFSHVGIYLGDNQFIHAPSSGKSVQVDNLNDSYWVRHFTGARHIDTEAATAAASAPPAKE